MTARTIGTTGEAETTGITMTGKDPGGTATIGDMTTTDGALQLGRRTIAIGEHPSLSIRQTSLMSKAV